MSNSFQINTEGGNIHGNNFDGQGNIVHNTTYYYSQQKQDLAQAAAEIQQLLEQLDKTYSTDTTTGKMVVATEAIKRIDRDPTLASRILSALKSGGVQAFEQFLSHPAASFVIGALQDWQKTKDS